MVWGFPGEEKSIRLKSGVHIVLEPNPQLAAVYIGVLIDRSAYLFSGDTLQYFDAIAQKLQQLLSEKCLSSVLYLSEPLPRHPYNWLEQKYIFSYLNSDHFFNEAEKITQIFRDLKKSLNFSYKTITVPLNPALQKQNSAARPTVSLSRSDVERFIDTENPSRFITVRFYGNFDPLVLLRLFHEEIVTDNLNRQNARPGRLRQSSVQALKEAHGFTLRLPPTDVLQHVALEFLSDFLPTHTADYKKSMMLEILMPWSREHQLYSVRTPFDMDWQPVLKKLRNINPSEIREWYYDYYIKKIQLISSDPETYVFYKQISYLYYSDSDRLFRLWLPDAFPAESVAATIRQICAVLLPAEEQR